MAKEICFVPSEGIPEDALFSVRAGSVRRQAAISSGKPFRFPKIGIAESPIKIDILQCIGTAYIVVKPDHEYYQATFKGPHAEGMSCEIVVRTPEGEEEDDKAAEAADNAQTAKDAKAYLESHSILTFVQAVLQTVVKERPEDPYQHIARHFACGYDVENPSATRTATATAFMKSKKIAAMEQTQVLTQTVKPAPIQEMAGETAPPTPVAAAPAPATPVAAEPAPPTPAAAAAEPEPAAPAAAEPAPATPVAAEPAPPTPAAAAAEPEPATPVAAEPAPATPVAAEPTPPTPAAAAAPSPTAAGAALAAAAEAAPEPSPAADNTGALKIKLRSTLAKGQMDGSLGRTLEAKKAKVVASPAPVEPAPAAAETAPAVAEPTPAAAEPTPAAAEPTPAAAVPARDPFKQKMRSTLEKGQADGSLARSLAAKKASGAEQ